MLSKNSDYNIHNSENFFDMRKYIMQRTKLFSIIEPLKDIQGATNYIHYDSDMDRSYEQMRTPRVTDNIIMVPYWVADSLDSVQYDYMKLLNYAEARKLLNEDQILSMLVLDNLIITTNMVIKNGFLTHKWNETKGSIPLDLNVYLKLADGFKTVVISRLSKDIQEPKHIKGYELVNTEGGIFVVMYPHFFHETSKPEGLLSFMRDLLKELYTRAPLCDICVDHKSTTLMDIPHPGPMIFRSYLELLR